MKFLIYSVLLTFLTLTSCGGSKEKEPAVPEQTREEESVSFNYDTLKGLYKGDFGDSPITLNLSYVSENHVTGYNIVKGNKRNVSGVISIKGKEISMKLSEPGDDKNDGVFTLYMNTSDLVTIGGEWESATGEVKSLKVSKLDQDADDEQNYFGNYSRTYTDSIGDLEINPNGSCIYEYYENKGETTEQLKQVKGSWKHTGDLLTVFWQQNTVFKNRKSVFTVATETIKEDEYEYTNHFLAGENRQLQELEY